MISKAQARRLKEYARTPVEDQAVIYSSKLKASGMFWFLPMVGWVEPKQAQTQAQVILSGVLLRIGDHTYQGSASWQIPATTPNHEPLLILMASLGWNGCLWPIDGGWPSGAPEEPGLKGIIQRVPVNNTFSFSADPQKGNRVIKVLVSRTSGTPLLPPDVAEEDRELPTEAMRKRLAEALADPSLFMPDGWSPEKVRNVQGRDFTS